MLEQVWMVTWLVVRITLPVEKQRVMDDGASWLFTQHDTPAPGMVRPPVSTVMPRKPNYVMASQKA